MKNGDILENLTVKLYQKMGFDVEQDIILEGKSGSIHQIDVIAKKKSWRKKKRILLNVNSERIVMLEKQMCQIFF